MRGLLDQTIEGGAPGFRDYLAAYAQHSRPIEAMQHLQGLNVTDAQGKIVLGKLDGAIKAIEKQRGLPGPRTADSISDDQLQALRYLRDDLRREGNSALGKSLGSNTFQNLATNQVMAGLGNPLVHMAIGGIGASNPLMGALAYGGRTAMSGLASRGERLVQQALQERLLDPSKGVNALTGR